MRHLSLAAAVARAPSATYTALLARNSGAHGLEFLTRFSMLALLNGTVFAILATERVGLLLVSSVSLYWLMIPLLQLATGLALVLAAPGRRVPLPRALALFFLGHLPWSMWMLGLVAALTIMTGTFPNVAIVAATALVPLAWTLVIVVAFCRTVLAMPSMLALTAMVVHQGVLWGTAALAVWWSSGGWARTPGLPGQ